MPPASELTQPDAVRCDDIKINFATCTIYSDAYQSSIEPKIMQVLQALVCKSGKVVSRTELHETVWDGIFVTEDTLNRAIHVLRKELSLAGRDDLIRTIPRKGYQFTGTVEPLTAEPGSSSATLEPRIHNRKRARNWLITGATAAVATVALGFGVVVYKIGNPSANSLQMMNVISPQDTIDRRAIRSALWRLIEGNKPVDAAVSSLIDTRDFKAALTSLRVSQDVLVNQLSTDQYIDFLHQVGALAFDRDTDMALALYKEILALDSDDALALSQIARLYLFRSEQQEARHFIEHALAQQTLTPAMRLDFEIDLARANMPPFEDAITALEGVAARAHEQNLELVEARATRFAVNYQWLLSTTQNTLSETKIDGLIEQLISARDIQQRHDQDHELARTEMMLGLMFKLVKRYPEALSAFNNSLEIEKLLHRPTRLHAVYTNLAVTHLEMNELEQATFANSEAIAILRKANFASDLHYNWMLAAKIAHASGQERQACTLLDKALQAWPDPLKVPGEYTDLATELACA